MNKSRMNIELGGINLKNPIITASGTCGSGSELSEFINIEDLGALTVKGITVEPSHGNELPRIAESPSGLLNSIGLENPGLETFIEKEIPFLRKYKLPVFVNISGHSLDDFSILAEKLNPYNEISALEVNVSCPNLEGGGMAFGTDSDLIFKVVKRVKEVYSGKIIVKLSPNVTDITEMAQAAEDAGADIISLINTLLGMAVDVEKRKPVLGNTFGGLSGPAVKPVALRMVYEVYENTNLPLIGMGGVMSGRDALEFIMAGASAVAVGTATLVNPISTLNIIKEIDKYLEKKNVANIKDLIGIVHN